MKINKPFLIVFLLLSSIVTSAQNVVTGTLSTGCWKQLAVGSSHVIALKNDGTLWSWGFGSNGVLGYGTSGGSSIVPVQLGTDTNWKLVDVTNNTSFALKTDGTLWAWGYNSGGQYGNGTTTTSYVPLQIGTDTDWKDLSANTFAVLAIKTNGTLWGWGSTGGWGTTGNGTSAGSASPIQIGTSTNWKQVSAGTYHSAALQNDGTIWGWGNNANGQFGNGNNSWSYVPIQMGTLNTWKYISAGQYITMGIKTDGSLWISGSNMFGQFGNGTSDGSTNTFIRIGTANNWVKVNNSFSDTMAIKSNGTLWGWGNNWSGQLGIGTTVSTYVPTQIGTATTWEMAAVNSYCSGAVRTDGTLWTWGFNNGRLGNGTLDNTTTPGDIGCPQSLDIENPLENHSVSLYPNPTKDELYIRNESGNRIEKVAVYDLLSKKVLEVYNEPSTITLSHLPSGIYTVQIVTTSKSDTFKIVKL